MGAPVRWWMMTAGDISAGRVRQALAGGCGGYEDSELATVLLAGQHSKRTGP